MKRICIPVFICVVLVACLNKTDKEKANASVGGQNNGGQQTNSPAPEQPRDSSKYTSLQWLDSSKSLGTITAGDVLKINYKFKNTGTKPLIIEKVQPGCGCTIADYPKEPIGPGQVGEIKAEFDSHGKEGMQKKNISVFANTAEGTYTLWFDVTINKAK